MIALSAGHVLDNMFELVYMEGYMLFNTYVREVFLYD